MRLLSKESLHDLIAAEHLDKGYAEYVVLMLQKSPLQCHSSRDLSDSEECDMVCSSACPLINSVCTYISGL